MASVNNEWKLQSDGTCWIGNSSGQFVMDSDGRLLSFEVTKYHSVAEDGKVVIDCLEIPEGITSIGQYTSGSDWAGNRPFFVNLAVRDEFSLPGSLRSLGQDEFSNCSLPDVALPAGLREIGSSAFSWTEMREVSFQPGLERMGTFAFGKSKMTVVVLPEGMKSPGSPGPNASLTLSLYGRNFKEADIACLLIPESSVSSFGMMFMESKIHRVVRYSKTAAAKDPAGWNAGWILLKEI